MNLLVKILLGTFVVPVMLFIETAKKLWGLAPVRSDDMVIFACIFLPLLMVLCGFELVSYLGWTLGVSWALWTLAFVAFEVFALGVLVPIIAILSQVPVTWLSKLLRSLFRLAKRIDRFFFDLGTFLGSYVPLLRFWRDGGAHRELAVHHYAFHVILSTFTSLSALLHVGLVVVPAWNYLSTHLEIVAPWLAIATHVILIVFVYIFAVLPVAYFSLRPVIQSLADQSFGTASIYIILNIARFTPLVDRIGLFLAIPTLFGIYLVSFIVLMPILCHIASGGFFKALVRQTIALYRRLTTWLFNIYRDDDVRGLLAVLNIFIVFAAFHQLGIHFSIHFLVSYFHALLVATITCSAPLNNQPGVVWNTFTFLATVLVLRFEFVPYTSYPFFGPLAVIGIYVFCLFVTFIFLAPLFAIVFKTLAIISSKTRLNRAIVWLHQKEGDLWEKIRHFWGGHWDGFVSDRSNHASLVGWLTVATFVAYSTLQYGSLFVTGHSPTSVAVQLVMPNSLPKFGDFFAYRHVEREGLNFEVKVNQTINEVHNATVSMQNQTIANTTATFAHLAAAPSSLVWYFADLVFFIVVALNVLISIGKAFSNHAGMWLSLSSIGISFSVFRHLDIFKTNYAIFHELLAAEFAILVSSTVLPAVYFAIKWALRNHIAKIAPMVCIPFERLWSMQLWVWRTALDVWFEFVAYIANYRNRAVAEAPKPVPKYVRPNRYG